MSVDKDYRYVQCPSTPMLALTKVPIAEQRCVLPAGHNGHHQDRNGIRRLR